MLRRLTDIERRLRARYDVAPVDEATWARARIYNTWFDHAILRGLWTNEAEIAPGVFRSNHPTKARLMALKARGVVSVLSLRGNSVSAHNETERLWCEEIGLRLHRVSMKDNRAPRAETIAHLLATFREIERPFVMHCKAGADRAGLASAVYLMAIGGVPLAQARGMLSWRFWHLRRSRAGVLDAFLDAYEADGAEAAMPFETWVATRYDRDAVNRVAGVTRGKRPRPEG